LTASSSSFALSSSPRPCRARTIDRVKIWEITQVAERKDFAEALGREPGDRRARFGAGAGRDGAERASISSSVKDGGAASLVPASARNVSAWRGRVQN
jgi:hypothetical protein